MIKGIIMVKIILLAVMIISVAAFNQYTLSDTTVSSAALISFNYGNTESFGSGFFYSDSTSLYLITAKHVIFDEIKNIKTNETIQFSFKDSIANIYFYPKYADRDPIKQLSLDLIRLSNSGNVSVSNFNDIAVIRLGKQSYEDYPHIEYSKYVKKHYPKSTVTNYVKANFMQYDDVEIGNDVFIIGYPKVLGLQSLKNYDVNRPLMRKGCIAGKNPNERTIIIDCPSYGGNSGGPVIMAKNGAGYLIGLVTQFIPFEQKWVNLNYNITNTEISNSGYSIVVPIEDVLEVIKAFK